MTCTSLFPRVNGAKKASHHENYVAIALISGFVLSRYVEADTIGGLAPMINLKMLCKCERRVKVSVF
jgi:hypothetical protein